ncbi:MAG: hypothetical protein K2X82_10475 [Gemmataceae bacterium]|nr:hypothetical protein [Gemmataceae bacterium]
MSPLFRVKPSTEPTILLTPSTEPKLDPAEVAAALGAEPTGTTIPPGGSPMTKFAARREAFRRLTGGPLNVRRERWEKLNELAAAVRGPAGAPSPEQVADVLLAWALERVEKGELPDALRRSAPDSPPAAG